MSGYVCSDGVQRSFMEADYGEKFERYLDIVEDAARLEGVELTGEQKRLAVDELLAEHEKAKVIMREKRQQKQALTRAKKAAAKAKRKAQKVSRRKGRGTR